MYKICLCMTQVLNLQETVVGIKLILNLKMCLSCKKFIYKGDTFLNLIT